MYLVNLFTRLSLLRKIGVNTDSFPLQTLGVKLDNVTWYIHRNLFRKY